MVETKLPEPTHEQRDRYNNFSIEIDCPPGSIRPNDCIGGILEGTGLEVSDFNTSPPFFGHQTWVLKENAGKDAIFTEHRYKTFKPRLEALYESGTARYCSW